MPERRLHVAQQFQRILGLTRADRSVCRGNQDAGLGVLIGRLDRRIGRQRFVRILENALCLVDFPGNQGP